jgi:hypothetical protein
MNLIDRSYSTGISVPGIVHGHNLKALFWKVSNSSQVSAYLSCIAVQEDEQSVRRFNGCESPTVQFLTLVIRY